MPVDDRAIDRVEVAMRVEGARAYFFDLGDAR
jgi:hypothetical protein